jgi:uncharacterized protein YicC (UPF0701 family)
MSKQIKEDFEFIIKTTFEIKESINAGLENLIDELAEARSKEDARLINPLTTSLMLYMTMNCVVNLRSNDIQNYDKDMEQAVKAMTMGPEEAIDYYLPKSLDILRKLSNKK